MLIELQGGGFHNKGAQLMLLSAMAELARRLPEARFCVESGPHHPWRECGGHGLRRLFPAADILRHRRFPLLFAWSRFAGRFVGTAFCDRWGLARRQDPVALVDISGFAFGDAETPDGCRNFAIRARSYRRRGLPVILLPQMFGPFTKPEPRRQVTAIVRDASLVFARDAVSARHLRELVGDQAEIATAPDITINDLHESCHSPIAPPSTPYCCLIPNQQVLRHQAGEWSGGYPARLVAAGRHARERGLAPVIVVHADDPGDATLARAIAVGIDPDGRCPVITDEDPLALKHFLGRSRLVIGSRFHAVLGALSTGVPAIVIGWAHKYEGILHDFAMDDLVHRASDPEEHLSGLIDLLIRDDGERRRILGQRKEVLMATNAATFDRVAAILRSVP